ncbi:hypothetical protein BDK92_7217 [Micromonospora pisi]|uniref:Uncharacterized protein n=1 Tax=Micromonospora pisi TaxID=589240 RepID=A0A495JX30_9ACTN|nr:hypothetical protein BDK92_7217 [Micromonospora pisi]
MADGWHWETRDAQGTVRAHGSEPMWGTPEDQARAIGLWVMNQMAQLVWAAAPDYDQLAGVQIRAWSTKHRIEAVATGDEWLETLRPADRVTPDGAPRKRERGRRPDRPLQCAQVSG